MQDRVKVRLSISEDAYKQMKQHQKVDWNEAAIKGIAKECAAAGVIIGGKGHRNPRSKHQKL